jgi:transcriptional regulator with XRE-family HTH domain
MPAAAFGEQLRGWRQRRGLSQLQLSGLAEVSTRHLSWLESGKAVPSRAMVLRLCDRLDVPLRERNALLAAAGYAPMYAQRALDDPALAAARAAVQRLLDAHEPWPALAVDRGWHLVAHNRLVPLLLATVAPALQQPPVNVLRLSLHPQGLAPMIEGLPAWRDYVLLRLRRQIAATGDDSLKALHDELQALPPPPGHAPWPSGGSETASPAMADDVAVPLSLRTPLGTLRFITTMTVFGAPRDITLSELAVETLLPADAATGEILRQMLARVSAGAESPADTATANP